MTENILYSIVLVLVGIFNGTVATSKYVRGGKWGWRLAFCTGAIPAIIVGFVAHPIFGVLVAGVALYLLVKWS